MSRCATCGPGGTVAGSLLLLASIAAGVVLMTACTPAHPRDRESGGGGSPAAPEPSREVVLRLPPDAVFGKEADSPGPVTFRHATHVASSGNRCVSCHPQPFRMLRPARRVRHVDMDAGRACGLCHDGRKAFGTAGEDCERCHVPGGTQP